MKASQSQVIGGREDRSTNGYRTLTALLPVPIVEQITEPALSRGLEPGQIVAQAFCSFAAESNLQVHRRRIVAEIEDRIFDGAGEMAIPVSPMLSGEAWLKIAALADRDLGSLDDAVAEVIRAGLDALRQAPRRQRVN